MKALQIATFNAARLLKQDTELGSIAAGKRADFVLVDGNPGVRIADIRRCQLVMKNGVLYDSAKIYSAVGIQPDRHTQVGFAGGRGEHVAAAR
jgi:imidazolonepropionase-like amidohydrolase